jgi:hypothetical protein
MKVKLWFTGAQKKEVLLDELTERPSEAYVEDLERTQQQQWQQVNKNVFFVIIPLPLVLKHQWFH